MSNSTHIHVFVNEKMNYHIRPNDGFTVVELGPVQFFVRVAGWDEFVESWSFINGRLKENKPRPE